MKKTDPPITVTETFDCSINQLWSALTEPEQMIQWYFEQIREFRPESGFETEFVVKVEDRIYTHQWKILEVRPLELIELQWRYEEHDGDASVKFHLSEEDDLSKLRLTMNIYEDFPSNIPEFERSSCIEGWNYFIKQRLKDYIERQ